ncbi:MAG TPA: T9SS type A sorting domain-containing protein [Bacteroidota bacterium]|nr:T9SS type A sorting domain-containing protein [Bacteroidota bacterium]
MKRTLLLLLLASSVAYSQTPGRYNDLYQQLDTKLTDIDAWLRANWDGAPHAVAWGAELITANGNRGADLLKPNSLAGVALLLDRFEAMGVRGVKVSVLYPLLKPGFPRSAEYLAFYAAVAREVRNRNMKLHVQCTTVFPDTSWSRIGVDYSGLTMPQFRADLRQHVETVLTAMRPDWLSITNEPMTQKMNTGLDFTVAAVTELVQSVLTGLDRGSTLIGAGTGSWDDPAYAQALAATSLDFLDLHVYPINSTLFIDRAATFAGIARNAGKRLVISESWLFKVRDSEVGASTLNAAKYYARDVFDFWKPLDVRFIDAMVRFAQYAQAEFCSFFWIRNFYAYIPYDDAKDALPPTQLFALCDAEAGRNILGNALSETGVAYKDLIARYTTEVHPVPPRDARTRGDVFPNPVNGTLTLSNMRGEVVIHDMLGRIHWSGVVDERTSIDVSTFPRGVYAVRAANTLRRVAKL